jgi:hypothetical protein
MNEMKTKANVKPITLEEYLVNLPIEKLMDIEEELLNERVPATGPTHSEIRYVNRMIDKGLFCINPMTYRKVYLPTFARAVHKEMARRFYNFTMVSGGYYAKG